MGDRAQVLIKDTGVYLYTHWNGSLLKEHVKTALSRKQRWDDPEYLARIIFCEMVKGKEDKETGYGIGTTNHSDVFKLITINCKSEEITVETEHPSSSSTTKFQAFIEE